MKLLLVLAVVFIAVYFWRQRRRAERPHQKPPPATPAQKIAQPQAMVACVRCGLHLPEADAVQGHEGSYCSSAHRHLAEDR